MKWPPTRLDELTARRAALVLLPGVFFFLWTSLTLASGELGEAIKKGDVQKVTALLVAGADVAAADTKGRTPLHYAAQQGSPEIVELLLAHGAKLDARDALGYTPLQHAILATQGEEVAKLLLKHGADANAQSGRGLTPLHSAVHFEKKTLVDLLLQSGAKTDITADNGVSPLMLALLGGSAESIVDAIAAAMNVRVVKVRENTLITRDSVERLSRGVLDDFDYAFLWTSEAAPKIPVPTSLESPGEGNLRMTEFSGLWQVKDLLFMGSAVVRHGGFELREGGTMVYPNAP